MRTRKGARTAMLALLGVLGIGLASGAAGSAAPARTDFALGVSPAAQSVWQGQSTAYTVTTTARDGFTGTVSLNATGKPAGATTAFTPATIALSTSVSSRTATLMVGTGTSTPTGTYNLTISAASGSLSHTTSVLLTVNRARPPTLALSASPSSNTVPAGSTAAYTVAINRTNFTGPVTIAVATASGISASVRPNPTSNNSTTVQLTTSPSTKDGIYPVEIAGWAAAAGTIEYASTQVSLVVSTPKGKPFTISGNLTGTLAPGVPARPLNLTLINPNNQKLSITNLAVTVSGTSSCGPANFAVTQYSGSYPLNLAANQTATLTQLGVPTSALPTVGMRDLSTNQDACKGVTVNLVYSGTGQGA
ncbi:MAG TPA: hypothetical protein VGM75_15010 [Pseudonocardiaceae bacterium]